MYGTRMWEPGLGWSEQVLVDGLKVIVLPHDRDSIDRYLGKTLMINGLVAPHTLYKLMIGEYRIVQTNVFLRAGIDVSTVEMVLKEPITDIKDIFDFLRI